MARFLKRVASVEMGGLRVWIFAVAVGSFIAGLATAYLLVAKFNVFFLNQKAGQTASLRGGRENFRFINPLLVCDITETRGILESGDLSDRLASYVGQQTKNGNIITASVYYRSLTNGNWVDMNENEKYNPASLNKVPLMMAYYKLAENDPIILSKKLTVPLDIKHYPQDIEPPTALAPGASYSTQELIRRMIQYSDNDAYNTLLGQIDLNYLKEIYSDLGIPVTREDPSSVNDYATVKSYSLFFRLLYNATYSTWDGSEKMLDLLSQVSFKDGLVAGVPQGIKVAHKFGTYTVNDGEYREMHDCGIVYAPNDTYQLCVMTKSRGEISRPERVISNISAMAYKYVLEKSAATQK